MTTTLCIGDIIISQCQIEKAVLPLKIDSPIAFMAPQVHPEQTPPALGEEEDSPAAAEAVPVEEVQEASNN